jgi:hypothetical protein
MEQEIRQRARPLGKPYARKQAVGIELVVQVLNGVLALR